MKKNLKKITIAFAIFCLLEIFSNQSLAELNDLGAFDNSSYSYATAISADGSVIVGSSNSADGERAFKYTASDGMVSLGTLNYVSSSTSSATAISADGSLIVGNAFINYEITTSEGVYYQSSQSGFKYETSLVGIPAILINGVSADGSLAVGYNNLSNLPLAYKVNITNQIMTPLGVLDGGTYSSANAISADGSVIVGYSDSTNGRRAFKYTASDGMVSLETLAGGSSSYANGVSADGSVIVGGSDSTEGLRAFKYTTTNGMISLGNLGNTSVANGVSADGLVIVGNFINSSSGQANAFKYTASDGMVFLGVLDGGTYSSANAVSADGSVIVGDADNALGQNRAFIYNNSSTSGGGSGSGSGSSGGGGTTNPLVDEQNTYTTLYYNGAQLNSVINLKNSLLRSTLTQDCNKFGANGICVAVGGRYGNSNKYSASEQALNLRLAYRVNSNLKTGIILDQAFTSQDPTNYSVKNSQPMLGAFVNLSQNSDETGFNLRLSGAYHNSRVNVSRNVLSGTEGGVGITNLKSSGLLAEISYLKNFSDQLQLKPFFGLRKTQVQRDRYTENNNVSFPISYNAVAQKSDSAIFGIKSTYRLKENLGINLGLGIERNFRNKMDGYVGTIPQVRSFILSSPNLKKHTAFIDAGFYYDLKANQRFNTNVIYSSQTLNSANAAMVYAGYALGF
jgi:probable HAF family extracellular repeat protein